jgi:hypothetical protein
MSEKSVDLNQLKAVLVRLIDEAAKRNKSHTFEFQHDLYWVLPFEDQLNLSKDPTELDVGNLHDDWEMTKDLADEPTEIGTYALTEVAQLLWYIGHELSVRNR